MFIVIFFCNPGVRINPVGIQSPYRPKNDGRDLTKRRIWEIFFEAIPRVEISPCLTLVVVASQLPAAQLEHISSFLYKEHLGALHVADAVIGSFPRQVWRLNPFRASKSPRTLNSSIFSPKRVSSCSGVKPQKG